MTKKFARTLCALAYADARSLVLALWKFLHISQLQKEHGLTESFVSEIVPMPQSAVQGLASDGSQGDPTLPSIADLVTVSS